MRGVRRGAAPLLLCLLLSACGGRTAPAGQAAVTPAGSMELRYATQFSVDCYDGGAALVTIGRTDRFWVLPEGAVLPEDAGEAAVLYPPLEHVYLASSSVMDLFRALDALDAVTMTSTDAAGWAIPELRRAVEAGEIRYVGKYGSPDYERILDEGCALAVENTMIYHKPETLETLEALGVPVLVERSSYESHPLGRLEWIKLYGLLVGKQAQAQALFDEQAQALSGILSEGSTGKTAAFFYITNAGAVNVHRPGDYVSKLLELAGGENVLSGLPGQEDSALSTMNIQFETFYRHARDADVLIYNSAVGAELSSLDRLLERGPLLADFKAVREGGVWCTGQNLFQQTTGAAEIVADLHAIFTGTAEDQLTFLHRLR